MANAVADRATSLVCNERRASRLDEDSRHTRRGISNLTGNPLLSGAAASAAATRSRRTEVSAADCSYRLHSRRSGSRLQRSQRARSAIT